MDARTTNGAACLTLEGATVSQTAIQAERGAALTAMSQHLVGPRTAILTAVTDDATGSVTVSGGGFSGGDAAPVGAEPGLTVAGLRAMTDAVLAENDTLGDDAAAAAANLVDLLCLAFHTGDVREGKAERQLFVWMLLEVARVAPATVAAAVPLIPTTYASFRTLNLLYATSLAADAAEAAAGCRPCFDGVRAAVVEAYTSALRKDQAVLARSPAASGAAADAAADADAEESKGGGEASSKAKPSGVSLAGKWAPRPRCSAVHRPLARALRAALFPHDADDVGAKAAACKQYRQLLAALSRRLDVVEVKMSAGKWADITPEAIPAVALQRCRNALRNLTSDGRKRKLSDADRHACAVRVEAAAAATVADPARARRLKGAGASPAALAGTYLPRFNPDTFQMDIVAEDPVVEAGWASLVQGLKDTGTLRSAVSMVDVSGSMAAFDGELPLKAAIALGLITSAVAPEPFQGRVLTFASEPAWHEVDVTTSLRDRVTRMTQASFGDNTDVCAAMDAVLAVCVAHAVPQDAVPEVLFIFTDMQFDAATDSARPFAAAEVQERFAAEGYKAPHVVFWNLATTAKPVFHAETDTPGVSFMAGVSPHALTTLFAEGVEGLAKLTEVTPWDTLQATLASKRLDAVRRVCVSVREGPMAAYSPPAPASTVAAGAGAGSAARGSAKAHRRFAAA